MASKKINFQNVAMNALGAGGGAVAYSYLSGMLTETNDAGEPTVDPMIVQAGGIILGAALTEMGSGKNKVATTALGNGMIAAAAVELAKEAGVISGTSRRMAPVYVRQHLSGADNAYTHQVGRQPANVAV